MLNAKITLGINGLFSLFYFGENWLNFWCKNDEKM